MPHGVVHVHSYQSRAFEATRRLHVYTPPGYAPVSPTHYPVLYLLNGGADDDATWTIIGKANLLMDNLLAEGKIMPMILVMPNGRPKAAPPWREDHHTVFEHDLLDQVIPLIESSYRVQADASHRAISGISMGGMQTLLIGLRHLDVFAYLIPLSIGPGFDNMDMLFGEVAANHQRTNARLRLLSIYCGTEDHQAATARQVDKWLTLHQIRHELHTPPGKHNWQLWRSNLAEFAPRLFRD